MKRFLLGGVALAIALPVLAADKPAEPVKAPVKASTVAKVPTGVDVKGCTYFKTIDGQYVCTDKLPYERDIERKPYHSE
jgi:hypothetical protein